MSRKAGTFQIALVDDAVDEVADSIKELLPKPRTRTAGQAGGRRAGQSAGQKVPTVPDKRWSTLDVYLVLTVPVLLTAVALRWADMSGWAWAVLSGWCVALIGSGYWTATRRGRRVEVAQIVRVAGGCSRRPTWVMTMVQSSSFSCQAWLKCQRGEGAEFTAAPVAHGVRVVGC
ncbi:hypothetical protein Kisp01_25500 [Kineosporia sp. NBRC 101677]|nr:hypothetical protein Kisp01_25500 [Kineosporia sp. NBRC 101677]